jgi:hypothetical protein
VALSNMSAADPAVMQWRPPATATATATTAHHDQQQQPESNSSAAVAIAVAASGETSGINGGPADDALYGVEEFVPERWLDPDNAKSLAQNQMPFGVGQHYCLGWSLALTELTCFMVELARSYELQVEVDTKWVDFPIKRPDNGLPFKVSLL